MGGGHSHDQGAVYGNRDAVRAVVLSAGALGTAAVAELAAAFAGHSASVLADGLHNAGDVLTTAVLLISFRVARRPATRRFTAGFGRIEDVATLLIVVVIVVTAALAFWESVRKFFVAEDYGYVPFSLAAAAIGIVANLAVSGYKVRVGRGIHSTALEADGIHSRIDALVSAGALVGIGLAGIFHLRLADPIAGILITFAIVYVLAGTVRDLFYRMLDAVDPELIQEMTEAARRVPGVLAVHDVSARWVGRELWAVMHIDCDAAASLQQAHDVADEVQHAVSHAVEVGRLDVHMDPGTARHHHAAHERHDGAAYY
ncbi:MAG TPA: cation diffusion facilitator family transporter [Candidatus Dormibacteraeota bacterium]